MFVKSLFYLKFSWSNLNLTLKKIFFVNFRLNSHGKSPGSTEEITTRVQKFWVQSLKMNLNFCLRVNDDFCYSLLNFRFQIRKNRIAVCFQKGSFCGRQKFPWTSVVAKALGYACSNFFETSKMK